jgi:molybdopterin synthase catalytic subunit
MSDMPIRIQTQDFDLSAEVAQLRANDARVGAVVTFIGTVRDMNDGAGVAEMELEHYPGMTEKALDGIVAQARTRWNIYDALVIHRVGPLKPLEQIVLVAVTSTHRGEAFAACEFIMDYLKTQAPFWKKEQTPQGARWVDARSTDDKALEKWGAVSGNAAVKSPE